jgi:dihydrofolate synthase/folylpolyglutamate synthase
MNYQEALAYLDKTSNRGIKPGLERTLLMLEKLGHPEKGLSYVHVTGTNGKGSVASMLASIFQAAGLKTGKFTSPHLEKWNERVNICGQDVSDDALAVALSKAKDAAGFVGEDLGNPSQFELLTVAAFWLFHEAGLDIVVLEVGMGGLLDATNVIVPECAVITNVGLDHTEYLGDTLEAIATEKAGIIKPGVPVVTAAESVALNVIVDTAAHLKAPTHIFRSDFTAIALGGHINQQKFIFRGGAFVANFTLNLGGYHQVVNAALAVMTAKILAKKYPAITLDAIMEGLDRVVWPGRLELHQQHPDILLDGAHNINGALALRTALDKYYPTKNVVFVLGMMKDKDINGVGR